MDKILNAIALIFILNVSVSSQTVNEKYDEALAKSLNADDYGMKKYVLVLLKPGSNTDTTKEVRDSVFTGHMKNMNRLAESGDLVIAGPMFDNILYEGIFVLNADSKEAAAILLETDPAVSGKYLETEMYLWYGSAALQETTKLHRKIEKYSF
ncbi:MAG TPA: YciI family protein [Ignavibacteria bacterium]|nr:YciI family protein [Ignavibacteria bacterium]